MPSPEVLKVWNRAHKILEIAAGMAAKQDKEHGTWECSSRIEEIQLRYDGYAEPGYHGDFVVTGNWNEIDTYDRTTNTRKKISDLPCRVFNLLEKLGYECEWSDEWCDCSQCGKIVRTQPDSYRWKASFLMGDGEITCHECLLEDPEEYLRQLEDNHDKAITLDVDPCDHGYKLVSDEYETGFHPGQNDDPRKVAKELRAKGVSRFVFKIDASGQFDTSWSVYVHEDEWDLVSGEETEEPEEESEADRLYNLHEQQGKPHANLSCVDCTPEIDQACKACAGETNDE